MEELVKAARKVLANIERLDRNGCIGSILSSSLKDTVRLDQVALKTLRTALLRAERYPQKVVGHHRRSHDGPCEEGCYYETVTY